MNVAHKMAAKIRGCLCSFTVCSINKRKKSGKNELNAIVCDEQQFSTSKTSLPASAF